MAPGWDSSSNGEACQQQVGLELVQTCKSTSWSTAAAAGWQVQQRPSGAPPRRPSSASEQAAATQLSGEAPVTPLVWIVLWAGMTCNWIVSYHVGMVQVVWYCEPFLDKFVPGVLRAAQAGEWPATAPVLSPGQLPARVLHGAMSMSAVVQAIYHASKALTVPAAALVVRGYGRPACLLVGALLYLVGNILVISAFSAAQLLLGLVVPGMSAAFLHVAVLLADIEVAPSRVRGAIAVAGTLGSTSGSCAAYVAMLAPQLRLAPWGWRVAWGMALLPVLALLAAWPWLPESPVSLVQRGRVAAGREALRSIRGPLYSAAALEQELSDMQAAAGVPHVGTRGWVLAAEWRELQLLFSRRHAPMLLIVGLMLILFELVNKNNKLLTIVSWMTLRMPGGTYAYWHRYLTVSAVFAAFRVVGTLVAMLLVDTAGRCAVVSVGAVCSTGAVAAMAIMLTMNADIKGSGVLADPSWFAVFVLWQACSALTYAPIMAVRTEHYALEVRSTGVALGLIIDHVVQLSVIIGLDLHSRGAHWRTLVPFALAGYVLEAGLAAAVLPEAKGVPLERVAAVWRAHWLWRRWYARAPQQDAGGTGMRASREGSMARLLPSMASASQLSSARVSTASG